MKNSRKIIASLLVAAGIATAGAIAYAHPEGYGPGWGGHHSGMAGPGAMSGFGGGYGMGRGAMGGFGAGYGMGPGMMWGDGSGYGAGAASSLNLNAEQRAQIGKIQDDARRKQWEFMGKVHEEQNRLFGLSNAGTPDDAAISTSYRKLSELRQQMFDNSLATRKQIDGVLSKEQREQLSRGGYGRRGY